MTPKSSVYAIAVCLLAACLFTSLCCGGGGNSPQPLPKDTQAPTVPGGLAVAGTTQNSVSISWVGSGDNLGVAGYKIFRNSLPSPIGTTTNTVFTDTGLTPATTYTYTVAAFDAAGNVSATPPAVTAKTAATPPATPAFSAIPPQEVPLGQKMSPIDLLQFVQGGTTPYAFSVAAQTNPNAASAAVTDTILGSDYAFHGGSNVVTVQVTDAAGASAQTTVTLTVPVPTVAFQPFGCDFSPYEAGQDPNLGSIIGIDQMARHIGAAVPFCKNLRTFGIDHGLENFPCMAKEFGVGTWVGVWISRDFAANEAAVQTLIQLAKAGCVDVAIVGSEALLRNDVSGDQLNGYINEFRASVPNVPVTTGDVFSEFLNFPSVAANCDFLAANYYPFWEGKDISIAIADLNAEDALLRSTFPGKEVIVSETGWPSGGDPVLGATPSLTNAAFYFLDFESWVRAGNRKAFFFEITDESWKAKYGEGTRGATWGLFTETGAMKYGQDVFDGKTMPDNWTCKVSPGGDGTPSLLLTFVPPIGSNANLQGQEFHAAPSDFYVAVYINVAGGWWTKPTFAMPKTPVQCDGTWTTNIVTGGNDLQATQVAAFLLPNSFTPPALGGSSTLPPELSQNAVASVIVTR
jgi:exo-beta-1,3-glucanase (GH17 family)